MFYLTNLIFTSIAVAMEDGSSRETVDIGMDVDSDFTDERPQRDPPDVRPQRAPTDVRPQRAPPDVRPQNAGVRSKKLKRYQKKNRRRTNK